MKCSGKFYDVQVGMTQQSGHLEATKITHNISQLCNSLQIYCSLQGKLKKISRTIRGGFLQG